MAQDTCGDAVKRLCSNAAQPTPECDLSDRIEKVSSVHVGCIRICSWSCPLETGSLRMHLNAMCLEGALVYSMFHIHEHCLLHFP